ncbi:t-SNARE domain-containing protein 1-like [Procambarus clarkii]|uniref:t-SNARE domain-containing protein 1-like n=1 Tax=Procambarus clarkii TaxID=6728 RepID=UPI0037429330
MSGIKRKANFSEEELTVLVDEVKKRERIIFGKLSRQVTTQDKHCAWSQVAVAVSGVGLCSRQQADVRKKFQDLKSSVKKKLAENAREMRKTGGGECDTQPLTNYEENLSTLLSSTSVEGIAGISDAGQDYTVEEPNCVTEEVVMDTDDSRVLNVQESDVVHKVPTALKDVAAEVHEGNKSLKEVVKEVQDLNKSLNDISKDAYISPCNDRLPCRNNRGLYCNNPMFPSINPVIL